MRAGAGASTSAQTAGTIMSSDRGHGADVDLNGIETTLRPTRVARRALDALLGSLPDDMLTPATENNAVGHPRSPGYAAPDLSASGEQQHRVASGAVAAGSQGQRSCKAESPWDIGRRAPRPRESAAQNPA